MKIGFAGPWEVDGLWPRLVDGFQRSCEAVDDGYTAGELWQLCRSGQAFLCVVFGPDQKSVDMGSVWQFQSKDGRPVFRCLALFGHNMAEWVNGARFFIEGTARENGAKWLVTKGRRGWLRLFRAVQCGDDYEVEL